MWTELAKSVVTGVLGGFLGSAIYRRAQNREVAALKSENARLRGELARCAADLVAASGR